MPKHYSENSISQLRYFSSYLLSHFLINSTRKKEYCKIRHNNLHAHKLKTDDNFIENYNSLLVSAIKKDMYSSDNCPLFYALIISSFLDNDIF